MRRFLTPILFIFMFTACDMKINSNKQEIEKTETMKEQEIQKIEALLNQYKNSLNTSNAELAQSLYTQDGVFMPTEAPSGIGSEGILKSYEFVFSQIQLTIDFFIEEIVIENNMAFAVTNSKGTVKIKANGAEIPEANRELFVFKKVDNVWKIARYMFNKTEPKK